MEKGDFMNYGDKLIAMEGIIVELSDGAVSIDLKGRLGFLKVPMRMIICDYPLAIGQEVRFQMSFIETLGPEINQQYVSNLERKHQKKTEEDN